MDPKLQKFIEKAQATERKAYEKERDAMLLSLGLVNEDDTILREYSPTYEYPYLNYDPEKKAYYREIKGTPISITDEEYELLKKYVPKTAYKQSESISNGAETFLGVINIIVLLASIVCSVILMGSLAETYNSLGYGTLIGIIIILLALIAFSSVKVMLNISNNLHEINSKLK